MSDFPKGNALLNQVQNEEFWVHSIQSSHLYIMNNHEKKISNLWTFKMSKQIYFFRTMHQVWNNNVKQVRNIKLAYLPGLQKRTSMDGCNISSAPSSHLTKTLDEILWCSEPQNFLLKCICSISCKTNHKKTVNF